MVGLLLTRRQFAHIVLATLGSFMPSGDQRGRSKREVMRITEAGDIRTTEAGVIRIVED